RCGLGRSAVGVVWRYAMVPKQNGQFPTCDALAFRGAVVADSSVQPVATDTSAVRG
ncbi:hypothetical protein SARC_13151, partial [Sphaeroforma arctica JP610]